MRDCSPCATPPSTCPSPSCALLAGAAELTADYLAGLADRPILEPASAAERAERTHGGRTELPLDGESSEGRARGASGESSRTARHAGPGFFGYVASPTAPIGV